MSTSYVIDDLAEQPSWKLGWRGRRATNRNGELLAEVAVKNRLVYSRPNGRWPIVLIISTFWPNSLRLRYHCQFSCFWGFDWLSCQISSLRDASRGTFDQGFVHEAERSNDFCPRYCGRAVPRSLSAHRMRARQVPSSS